MGTRFYKIAILSLCLFIIGLLLIFLSPKYFPNFSTGLSSIGLSFLTAGMITLTIDRISLSIISSELNSTVEKGLNELGIWKYGIRSILDSMPYKEIYKSIDESNEFILIQTWSPDMNDILKHTEDMLRRGGKVTIFLLHPESCAAKQRSLDLNKHPKHVSEKIHNDSYQIQSLYLYLIKNRICSETDIKKQFKLFYYVSLPAFAFYKTEKKAWVSTYWHGGYADSGMTLEIDLTSDNKAKEQYLKHVHNLESHSHQVHIEYNKAELDIPDIDSYCKLYMLNGTDEVGKD
jgi:hypothetical protein